MNVGPTDGQIARTIDTMAARFKSDLISLTRDELVREWRWSWDASRDVDWNTYKFHDALDIYKRRCRRWEEHHNGTCCVVERVRDEYLMPRIREFTAQFSRHNTAS